MRVCLLTVVQCTTVYVFYISTQRGDSAVIKATMEHESATLRVLVEAGADVNLLNEVRYTVTVDTAPHIIPSCPY